MPNGVFGSAQRALSRSPLFVRAAVKLRNQAAMVVGNHLSAGNNPSKNGEDWLHDQIAPRASFFVDVGANVGSRALHFASGMSTPRGLLYEPSPETVGELMRAVALIPGLTVVPKAASDTTGTATLFAEPRTGERSSLVPGHSAGPTSSILIETVRLDEDLAERGVTSLDFLKIDAEGYDLHVLRGAHGLLKSQRVPVIQFEYNEAWAAAGSTLAAALSLLQGYGYCIALLLADGLRDFHYERYGEFYHYSNFVAFLDGALPAPTASVAGWRARR